MGIDYEFLELFCNSVLAKERSIRWVGMVNKNGIILAQKTRQGVKLLLTEEENEEYAASAIARQKTRNKFESRIGKLVYAFGRYRALLRATVPVNENYYILITFDVEEKNFDSIIMEHIVPLIKENMSPFAKMGGSI